MADAMAGTGTLIARPFRWWRSLSPLTRGLLWCFVVFAVVLPVILIATTGGRTAIHHIRHVLIWQIEGDSWGPVTAALNYLSVFPDQPVYTAIFTDNHIRFQYPPSSLLFIGPLYHLPQLTHDPDFWPNLVSIVIFVANVALIVLLLFRALAVYAPAYAPRSRMDKLLLAAATAGLSVTFTPLIASPDWGQTQTWISAAFAGAVLAWLEDRKRIAGVLIGLTVAFKPQLGLLLVWALLRREWRFSWAMFVTVLVIGVASLAVYGLAQHLNYLEILSDLSRHGESYWWNQSIMGLLHRIQFNGANTEAESILREEDEFLPPFNLIAYVGGTATSAIMILAALLWRRGEHERAPMVDFLLASLTFTVASPIAWVYHYGVAVPMFAVALPLVLAATELGRWRLVWLVLAFVLLHNRFDVTQQMAHTRLNVLESTFLFGALLLLWLLYRLRGVYGGAPSPASARLAERGAVA